MAIYHEDILDVDLNSGTIARSFLNHTIGEGDNKANRFGVRLFRDGEPVNVDDCECVGFFMGPDGTNLMISGANYTEASGNTAYVILHENCYAVEGQFCLAIKVIGGSITGTMRIIDGVVSNTGATGAVAPTSEIPSSAEIIAAYEEALALIDGVVRHDVTQSLSTTAQAKARENIGAAALTQVVRHDAEQSLSDAAKATARENIGAAAEADLETVTGKNLPNSGTIAQQAISTYGYIDSTGEYQTIEDTGIKCSGFISLDKINFILYNIIGSRGIMYLAFYDENEDFVSGLIGNTAAWSFHNGLAFVPKGAAYVRITLYNKNDYGDKDNQIVQLYKELPYISDKWNIALQCGDNRIYNNGYIDQTGAVVTIQDDGFKYSGYIDISAYKAIRYKAIGAVGLNSISYYDTNQYYMSGVMGSDASGTEGVSIIPAGAKYARFCVYNKDDGAMPRLDQHFLIADRYTLGEIAGFETVYNRKSGNINIFGYINGSGTVTPASDGGWLCTGFLPVEEIGFIEYYVISTPGLPSIAFYDENKTFLGGIEGPQSMQAMYGNVKIKENVRFIRLTIYNKDDADIGRLYQKIVLHTYATKSDAADRLEKILTGKTWCVLGDSRSMYESSGSSRIKYYDYIKKEYFVIPTIYAVGGKRMAYILTEMESITGTPDIISVYVGVNDWGQPNPTELGTIADDSTQNTFYGHTRKVVETLIADYPASKIFFITPVGQVGFADFETSGADANGLGYTIFDYCEAIRKVCREYSIKVYDDAAEGEYTPLIQATRETYFKDGLHQNHAGHKLLAENVKAFLASHF